MSTRRIVRLVCCLFPLLCIHMGMTAKTVLSDTVPLVNHEAAGLAGRLLALVVIPANPQSTEEYAAEELVRHIEMASGVRLSIAKEARVPASFRNHVYLGNTRAAAEIGIDVSLLPSEAVVLRTSGGHLFIAAQDGPGDPLEGNNTFSGALWGVYEVLERGLGVRWLWPGRLGTYVPKSDEIEIGPYDETITPTFVPWFRWAGWFPRTTEEHKWIKQQWIGWQRSGVSLYYRPNWFLDGWSMPHIYPHQFADAFQFYARHGMIGTDFDSLMGQWAAQGPHLYLLARIHVRPDAPVDTMLDEFYSAFGPAKESISRYFRSQIYEEL